MVSDDVGIRVGSKRQWTGVKTRHFHHGLGTPGTILMVVILAVTVCAYILVRHFSQDLQDNPLQSIKDVSLDGPDIENEPSPTSLSLLSSLR